MYWIYQLACSFLSLKKRSSKVSSKLNIWQTVSKDFSKPDPQQYLKSEFSNVQALAITKKKNNNQNQVQMIWPNHS